jgi:hypothetical protein
MFGSSTVNKILASLSLPTWQGKKVETVTHPIGPIGEEGITFTSDTVASYYQDIGLILMREDAVDEAGVSRVLDLALRADCEIQELRAKIKQIYW